MALLLAMPLFTAIFFTSPMVLCNLPWKIDILSELTSRGTPVAVTML